MSPRPQHGTPAGDAFLAIQKLARDTGADVQELLTLYTLEGLLTRVAMSHHSRAFVLKGGVLLAAFSLRRPTKDIDLQATGIANDVDDVLNRIREIATLGVDDGLIFDPHAITAQTIREDVGYPGVRVRLIGVLGRSRLSVGIDVNFGDPIWPAPSEITLPRLVPTGQAPIRILGYPLPMVVAEKAVTALDRGEANTRWRDFGDLLTIAASHAMSSTDLVGALRAVADYRGAELRPLLPALSGMAETAQPRWASWRRRQDHALRLPDQFADTLRIVAAFTDPVLGFKVPGDARWNPQRQVWESSL